jgi:uncharacterized protein (DUF1810 family)
MSDGGLDRFVQAQAGAYEDALAEIRAGRKRSHWMWFVFPQLKGLGRSQTAQFYGIASLDEARRYLADPVLGRRLRECARAVADLKGHSAAEVFGAPDDIKLRSSLTLFEAADPEETVFGEALAAVWGGQRDPATLERLGAV